MKNYIFVGSLVCAALPVIAGAKGLGQQALEEIVVTASQQSGSLTSVSVGEARGSLEQIPGGIGFVEVSDYQDNFTQSLGDTLVFTPGVFADTSAQRENRISIRGSGLNATFERRGISVYRDGVPITRASGITEFQEIDPLSVKYIEVFKGSNGLRYGSNALGGAINIVTPTGRNSPAGRSLRLEGGSFGSTRANLTTTGQNGNMDYYAAVTKLDGDGFRAHSEVDSFYGFANIGFALTENIETRFYLTSLDDQFQLAGSGSLDAALNKPETVVASSFVPASLPFLGGPGRFSAIDDDWDRNLKVRRLANRTVFAFDGWALETSAWIANRELDHAITRFAGIIVQDEDELGLSLRASNERQSDGGIVWTVGASYNEGDNDAKRFRNLFGQRGQQSSQDFHDAQNLSVYAQLNLPIAERWQLLAGAQSLHAVRENQHVPLSARDTEDDSGSLTYNELSPRIGVLWNFADDQQAYANISRAYEAPGISDLTSGGVLPFDPLDIQQSTTIEIGSRGQNDNWAWDVSIYRSEIVDEFIDLTSGFVTNTVNSESDTVHQGLEAGLDWHPDITTLQRAGMSLTWRNVLTLNDFEFDNHPLYGDNTLAGVPDVNYLTEISLSGERWNSGLSLRYVADGPYADFANTLQTEGYTLVGFNASWNVSDKTRVFVSAENLGDEKYISNVSTVGLANERSQIFTPGQGRASFIGVHFDF